MASFIHPYPHPRTCYLQRPSEELSYLNPPHPTTQHASRVGETECFELGGEGRCRVILLGVRSSDAHVILFSIAELLAKG